MFTGIVEGTATVRQLRRAGGAARLDLEMGPLAEGVREGDSVSVDGVCLTAAAIKGGAIAFDISSETLSRSTLGRLRQGEATNIERAVKVGDRLGGHFVLGHVDGLGRIESLDREAGQWTLRVAAEGQIVSRLVPKGSVAVDGISLTVASLHGSAFSIAVIPHTLEHTTLAVAGSGDAVNLELDILGKYVERLLSTGAISPGEPGGMTEEFLSEHGFI